MYTSLIHILKKAYIKLFYRSPCKMNSYSVLTTWLNITHCKYEILFALNEFKKRGLKETTKWYVLNDILVYIYKTA